DIKVRLRQLDHGTAFQTNQFAKLDAGLGDEARQSSAWDEMKNAEAGIMNGFTELRAQTRSIVAADEDYLNGKNAGANLPLSLQQQRAMAQTTLNLVQIMVRQATAAKALPRPARSDRTQRLAF